MDNELNGTSDVRFAKTIIQRCSQNDNDKQQINMNASFLKLTIIYRIKLMYTCMSRLVDI